MCVSHIVKVTIFDKIVWELMQLVEKRVLSAHPTKSGNCATKLMWKKKSAVIQING